eukprot:gene30920-41148_t
MAMVLASDRVGGGQQGQIVDPSGAVPPDLTLPLINEPAQASPGVQPVGPLSHLIGTWTNRDLGSSGRGGPASPFSYNLMVLPQSPGADPASPYGYILKSMAYYEEITFSQIHGAAANRGGAGTQVSNALLYEQRVYIADGPAQDDLVHFENGIWGYLEPMAQALGPYGDGNGPFIGSETFGDVPPALTYNIFKQISVPHGNSVLACGAIAVDANGNPTPVQGAPTINPPPSSQLELPALPKLPNDLTQFRAPAMRALPFSVDYPTRWGFAPRKLSLRGWCFAEDATHLKNIRASINGRTYPGVYGLKRMDVLAALRDKPQAEYCGWKVEVELREGDTHITLEVGDVEGAWQVFFKNDLNVGEAFDIAELINYERWVTTYD